VVKQQCSLAVCNKVEEQKEYKDIEKVSNVVGLLKIIKELTYNIRSVQYEHWVTTLAVRQLAICKQGDKESLPNFYRRFKSYLEMGEARFGPFVPSKLAKGADAEVEKKRFQACMFLASLNIGRYGDIIDELNNDFLAGNNNYPETIEDVVSRLSYRMNSGTARKNPKALGR
jgi:hypothetical protein